MPLPLLLLQDINLTFGVMPLLSGAALAVAAGDRICLVGRNGSGKSTLLRIAAGLVPPDRSEEHTSELQSQSNLVCRLLLEKKKAIQQILTSPAERPKTFHRGAKVSDQRDIGSKDDGIYVSATAGSNTSNLGHEYGTNLYDT